MRTTMRMFLLILYNCYENNDEDVFTNRLIVIKAVLCLLKWYEMLYFYYFAAYSTRRYFMTLKGNKFSISRDYSTTHDDIYDIVKILKSLRNILFAKLDIEIK